MPNSFLTELPYQLSVMGTCKFCLVYVKLFYILFPLPLTDLVSRVFDLVTLVLFVVVCHLESCPDQNLDLVLLQTEHSAHGANVFPLVCKEKEFNKVNFNGATLQEKRTDSVSGKKPTP